MAVRTLWKASYCEVCAVKKDNTTPTSKGQRELMLLITYHNPGNMQAALHTLHD